MPITRLPFMTAGWALNDAEIKVGRILLRCVWPETDNEHVLRRRCRSITQKQHNINSFVDASKLRGNERRTEIAHR